MKAVTTLYVNPLDPILTPDHARLASDVIKSLGGRVEEPDWLDPGIALDLPFDGVDPQTLQNRIADAFSNQPLDIACQPITNRRKKLLIADMDSTIINVECIDELADYAGLKTEISAITDAAMRGEIDFETALKQRVKMLKGLSEDTLQAAYDERVRLTPGAEILIRTMTKHDATTLLVSGGFTFFTGRIADRVGFHEHHANRLLIENGKLGGTVAEPIVTSETKKQKLISRRDVLGLTPDETMAVGDGANDIPMLEAAGLGVAYHAREKAIAAANMAIHHCDLTGILYIQGYRKEDFRL